METVIAKYVLSKQFSKKLRIGNKIFHFSFFFLNLVFITFPLFRVDDPEFIIVCFLVSSLSFGPQTHYNESLTCIFCVCSSTVNIFSHTLSLFGTPLHINNHFLIRSCPFFLVLRIVSSTFSSALLLLEILD